MNYSLYLARRLSLSSSGRSSSPGVKVAVAAVALSVAVMLAAVAIVFGFKREIRDKVVGFNSHITLYVSPLNEGDDNLSTLTPSLSQILDSQNFISEYSLQTSMPAILKTQDNFKGIYLRSAEGRTVSDFLSSSLEEGSVPDFSDEKNEKKILISRIAANQLGLKTGDKINTYFFTDKINVRQLEVAGVFNSHFDSYDDILVYGSLSLAQKLAGLQDNQGTSISITTKNFNNVDAYTQSLQSILTKALADGTLYRFYRVENAESQGAGYFRWLSLLDMNVVVVLVLMTFVACITLISGMLIIILDKKSFIGLIRSLGTPVSKVRKIFVYLALKIAFIGMILGNCVTLVALWLQKTYHIIPLDPESYYIDFVPVELSWPAFIILNSAVIVIVYAVLILPSWFVAKISPAETMRYE